MDRYNNYQTKQLHAHTYTCTHNSWWLVLGWVTTKEYHPLRRLDRQTSTYGVLTKTFNNNNNNNNKQLCRKRCTQVYTNVHTA